MKMLRRPSHSTIVAYLALFIALGAGGAYAANTIGSADVIDESLLSQDIKNGQVRASDIAANSIGSSRVVDNSLRGVDINQATLDGVVRSFGGRINGSAPGLVFSVPELKLSILGDTSVATSAGFRVRDDSSILGERVFGSDFTTRIDTAFAVDPTATSADQQGDGPFLLTAVTNPDLMLLFDCALGVSSQSYCFGELMRAPAP
jgi:hypothetical protein